MTPEQLTRNRSKDWERLSQLVTRSQSSLKRLTQKEVAEIGRLYRATSSDLALAQRDFPTHRVTEQLNRLVAHAHAVIYRGEPLATRGIVLFFTTRLPNLFRANARFVGIAALLFLIPAMAAGIATALAPTTALALLPTEAHDMIPMIEEQDLWIDIPLDERPYASSAIMTNNIRVSILAFAGGMLAGIPTVYVLILNGLLLGSITGLTVHYSVAGELWAFVIGHGVIELSMIFFAGGAGLMIGWAIIHPGYLRRSDAVRLAARDALTLVLGCGVFLVLAGIIEGFISPNESIPVAVKWLVGIGSGVLLYGYLFLAGRGEKSHTHDAS